MDSEKSGASAEWNEAEAILLSMQDDILVTNPDGMILRVSKGTGQIYEMDSKELLGKSVYDLEKQGIFTPLVTPMVVKEKKKITFIQTTKQGKKLLVTGIPVFDDQGELRRIVSYSHDVTELMQLKEYLQGMKDEIERVQSELDWLRSQHIVGEGMVAKSAQMKKVLQMASKAAEVDVHVVLLGESGVGKSHLAKWIHERSPRSKGPFIEVNCGAIPEALFEAEFFGYEPGAFTGAQRSGKMGLAELAQGGTLFLDEVAELSPLNQVKLLQFMQEKSFYRVGGIKLKKVDCRIIAATNQNLEELVRRKKFREDLYFRLNVVPITIPPLRQRREDILPLIEYFLDHFANKYRLAKKLDGAALQRLIYADWKGNVRELMNVMEQLVVMSPSSLITSDDLPMTEHSRPKNRFNWEGKTLPQILESVEKEVLSEAKKKYRTTIRMAEMLGISQPSVVRKCKKYGI